MKYNLVGTIFLVILMFLLAITIGDSCDGKVSEVGMGCNLVLILLLFFYFFLFSWPLSFIMYGYQSFKIYKITKNKRKYWTKVMKNNVKYTIVCVIYIIFCFAFVLPINIEEQTTIDVFLVLALYLSLFYIPSCWILLFVIYGYHRMGIFKITKPQPDVLSQSSGMTTTQITGIKEAKELLDKKIITNSEFEKIKNEYAGEDVVTRLKGIAELRDSGVFTESEFLEHKSKILSETSSQTDENLSSKDYDKYMTAGAVVGGVVIGLVVIFIIFLALSGSGGDRAYVEYNMGHCWSGSFHNGGSIISISGCGDESFNCMDGGDFCTINAQKDEDNSYELCVSIGSREACTTAAYGVAQV